MTTVYFRDHRTLGRDCGDVAGISYSNVLKVSMPSNAEEVDYLSQASHAVLHHDDDELKERRDDWQKIPQPTVCPIVLLVSEGGKTYLGTRQHEKWPHSSGKAVAYVLCARNQEQELEGDKEQAKRILSAFYGMTQDQAEAVYSNRLADCPAVLRPLFEPPPAAPEALIALAILCQGYLAVQVGPHGTPETDDPGKRVVAAIEEMRWDKILSSDEIKRSLDPRLTTEDQAGRDDLRKNVADPSFWNVFAESQPDRSASSVNLLQTVQKEWNTILRPGDFAPVRELVLKIESGRDPILPATLVAEAYLELVKKLEETNAS